MDIVNIVDSFSRTMGIHGRSIQERHSAGIVESGFERKEPLDMDIESTIKNLNTLSKNFNEKVQFSLHEKTNRIIIKVVNSDTNEVVREIPSRYSIKLLEHVQEYLGLFIDESR
jgi:uncharacterized FlaG/YvyC family protein